MREVQKGVRGVVRGLQRPVKMDQEQQLLQLGAENAWWGRVDAGWKGWISRGMQDGSFVEGAL
jgi:hypothetical protein